MTTKKEPEAPAEDPWDALTPDSLADSVAERLWAKMGESKEADASAEEEAPAEEAPKPTTRGKKFASWWMGQ